MDFNLIIDSIDICVIATDARGCVCCINLQAAKVLALDRANVIDRSFGDLLPSLESDLFKCISSGKPRTGMVILNRGGDETLTGQIKPLIAGEHIMGAVITFPKNKTTKLTDNNLTDNNLTDNNLTDNNLTDNNLTDNNLTDNNLTDNKLTDNKLTDNKLTDNKLADNKLESFMCLTSELEALFDNTSDGTWLCDGNGIVLKMNKAAERLNGISADEIVGKSIWYLMEKGFVERSVTGEVLKTRKRVNMIQHLKSSGKDLLVTATPVFDQDGEIFRVVVNEKDISGLNQLRKELERSRMVTEGFKNELSELSMLELNRHHMVAESEDMKQVLRIALKLANIGVSDILILGESGVGKGLLAKFIHKNSARNHKPFIQINCAALPETLLEAELFGYEKGAFTGARDRGKVGLIELAQEGTLFLDEIGDMPISIQTKLLNYLDDRMVRPLGGIQEKHIDSTIITATNRDLPGLIKQNRFREDFYFRLKTFTVTIPPLRERTNDILTLVNFYLTKFNKKFKQSRRMSPQIISAVQKYNFPGNVRELSGIIKQAVVMSDSNLIDAFVLSALDGAGKRNSNADQNNACNIKSRLVEQVREFEKEILEKAVSKCNSTRDMAKFLGINQSTVVRKLKKFALTGPSPHQTPHQTMQ